MSTDTDEAWISKNMNPQEITRISSQKSIVHPGIPAHIETSYLVLWCRVGMNAKRLSRIVYPSPGDLGSLIIILMGSQEAFAPSRNEVRGSKRVAEAVGRLRARSRVGGGLSTALPVMALGPLNGEAGEGEGGKKKR